MTVMVHDSSLADTGFASGLCDRNNVTRQGSFLLSAM